jgi:hypothetical protein
MFFDDVLGTHIFGWFFFYIDKHCDTSKFSKKKKKKPTQWLFKKRNNQSTPVITNVGRLLGRPIIIIIT